MKLVTLVSPASTDESDDVEKVIDSKVTVVITEKYFVNAVAGSAKIRDLNQIFTKMFPRL